MNARERMQALLDGKIVGIEGCVKYKLDTDGNMLVDYCDGDGWDVWQELSSLNDDELEIIEEYPLTFKEAMQEAINGKKIANEYMPEYTYWFDEDGVLTDRYDEKEPAFDCLCADEITAKWKVVE